jgi:hypothetical protein
VLTRRYGFSDGRGSCEREWSKGEGCLRRKWLHRHVQFKAESMCGCSNSLIFFGERCSQTHLPTTGESETCSKRVRRGIPLQYISIVRLPFCLPIIGRVLHPPTPPTVWPRIVPYAKPCIRHAYLINPTAPPLPDQGYSLHCEVTMRFLSAAALFCAFTASVSAWQKEG